MRTQKLALLLVLGSWMVPAGAGASSYRYQTDDGTIAVTDDLKRVPARYRDKVEVIPDRAFWDHPRLTIVPRGATIQAVWARDEAVTPAPIATAPAPPTVRVEVEHGVWIELEAEREPAIEVHREYRWVDGTFRPQTVVRQGERILAVRTAR